MSFFFLNKGQIKGGNKVQSTFIKQSLNFECYVQNSAVVRLRYSVKP